MVVRPSDVDPRGCRPCRREAVDVQVLVAKRSVEPFHEAAAHSIARSAEVDLHPVMICREVHHAIGELTSITREDPLRGSSSGDGPVTEFDDVTLWCSRWRVGVMKTRMSFDAPVATRR